MNKIYTQNYLITLIKCAIYDSIVPMPSSEIDWNYLYELSCKHRISPLIYFALDKLPDNTKNQIPQWDKYVFIYKQQLVDDANRENEINLINAALNKNKIDHIFLKGSVIKHMYPNSVMRSMSDIDILYRNSSEQCIVNIFNELGYKILKKEPKEIVFGKESVRVKIEMQTSLIDDCYFEWKKYLDSVWNNAIILEDYSYSMTNEMLYIYQIIHLAKHFKNGGIGLMHIIDILIINNNLEHIDMKFVVSELNTIKLTNFNKYINLLINYWFNDDLLNNYDQEIITLLNNYIINNGAFGTKFQSYINEISESNSNHLKILSKIFPSKEKLASYYGSQKTNNCFKRCWYTLLINIKRVPKAKIFFKTLLKPKKQISKTQINKTRYLFKDLDL